MIHTVAKVGAKTADFIRGKLSPEGVAAIKTLATDPQLGLTLLQQDALNKVGSYASVGDKSGVRRALLQLTEQVDVSSPKDGAVLVAGGGWLATRSVVGQSPILTLRGG